MIHCDSIIKKTDNVSDAIIEKTKKEKYHWIFRFSSDYLFTIINDTIHFFVLIINNN